MPVACDYEWLKERANWEPFMGIAMDAKIKPNVEVALTADIDENHKNLELKSINFADYRTMYDRCKEKLLDPSFAKKLSKISPVRIEKVHHLPWALLRTRALAEIGVYIQVNAELFPEPDVKRNPKEKEEFENKMQNGFELIVNEISTQKWCDSNRMIFHMSHDVGPNVVRGFFLRACNTLCSHVEKLTFFWHHVMTFNKDLPSDEWISLEKTGFLVIFFLQHVGLLPLVMRELDTFLLWNLDWQSTIAWNDGYPYFSTEYERRFRAKAEQSPFSKTTTGSLFLSLLYFYTEICPFGKGVIYFDQGKFVPDPDTMPDKDKRGIAIESVLMPEKHFDKLGILREIQCSILRRMATYLRTTDDDRHVMQDLIAVRRGEMNKLTTFLRAAEKTQKKK